MTTFSRSLSAIRNQGPPLSIPGGGILGGGGNIATNYQSAVRNGYQRNEIIFSAIELLATSAAEPHIIGRRYKDVNNKRIARERSNYYRATGMPLWAIKEVLNRQQIQEDLDERQHPLVKLLNNPNPLNSRFQFYSTFIMDRYLAGNAYALKARAELGNVAELWRLRPDRVRVLTDSTGQLTGYTYTVDRDVQAFPPEDVIHWKTRNPLDDHYGQPPLMALSGRLSIDNFMTDFVSTFFQAGGQPGAILTVKNKLSQPQKDEISDHLAARYGNRGGWFRTMVLTDNESTYTPMTQALGQRGLVMPELNDITEARIAMLFGIPPSILNLLVGLEKSSYANQRQDWQILWDVTLAPLYSDLDDQLNLSLTPEFGNIDEVSFDLSTVKALQEDVDKLHERARKNVTASLWPIEYAAICTGVDLTKMEGTLLIPANSVQVKVENLGEPVEIPESSLPEPAPVALLEAAEIVAEYALLEEARCPDCGKLVARNVRGEVELECTRHRPTNKFLVSTLDR